MNSTATAAVLGHLEGEPCGESCSALEQRGSFRLDRCTPGSGPVVTDSGYGYMFSPIRSVSGLCLDCCYNACDSSDRVVDQPACNMTYSGIDRSDMAVRESFASF